MLATLLGRADSNMQGNVALCIAECARDEKCLAVLAVQQPNPNPNPNSNPSPNPNPNSNPNPNTSPSPNPDQERTLKETLAKDYGAQRQFAPLQGECFDVTQGEWSYSEP